MGENTRNTVFFEAITWPLETALRDFPVMKQTVRAQISIILSCRLAGMGNPLWATLKVQHQRSTVLHKSRSVRWGKSRSNTLKLTYST